MNFMQFAKVALKKITTKNFQPLFLFHLAMKQIASYNIYAYKCIYPQILEKEMATHFSILVWKIQWTEETGGLQSMESQECNTTE